MQTARGPHGIANAPGVLARFSFSQWQPWRPQVNFFLPEGAAAAANGKVDGGGLFGRGKAGRLNSSNLCPPTLGPPEVVPHLNCRTCQQLQMQIQVGSQLGPAIYSRVALEQVVDGASEDVGVCFGRAPAGGNLPQELDGLRINVNHIASLNQCKHLMFHRLQYWSGIYAELTLVQYNTVL